MDKKRILIIDDEPGFTQLVEMNLKQSGRYEVRAENSGALGLAAVKQFKPDLILLDILMPGMYGDEVASRLKHDEDTKNIPIVFLTAVISKEEVERERGLIGGHPFIAKPVSAEELIKVIEKYI